MSARTWWYVAVTATARLLPNNHGEREHGGSLAHPPRAHGLSQDASRALGSEEGFRPEPTRLRSRSRVSRMVT